MKNQEESDSAKLKKPWREQERRSKYISLKRGQLKGDLNLRKRKYLIGRGGEKETGREGTTRRREKTGETGKVRGKSLERSSTHCIHLLKEGGTAEGGGSKKKEISTKKGL